jgi:phosphotransacetylase
VGRSADLDRARDEASRPWLDLSLEEAAKIKGIESPVAGRADILVVPDLESGNMLAKQLEYLAGAQSAGIVFGARVPIVLTRRADSPATRVASCAVALVFARRGPKY